MYWLGLLQADGSEASFPGYRRKRVPLQIDLRPNQITAEPAVQVVFEVTDGRRWWQRMLRRRSTLLISRWAMFDRHHGGQLLMSQGLPGAIPGDTIKLGPEPRIVESGPVTINRLTRHSENQVMDAVFPPANDP